ncbi:MAG: D-aminoacyl-tRNA deacylase [Polyangiaceae bacterium]
MRAVVQRVSQASVSVGGATVGQVGVGLVVLVGVAREDGDADAEFLADKVVGLRIFEDDAGKMNRSVQDVGGGVLAVSQFTLLGDVRKGRRPSFGDAMEPERARQLFEVFCAACRRQGVQVETGRFREHMLVELSNDGPVTILIDSKRLF